MFNKANFILLFYFTATGVAGIKCLVAAVKRLPVLSPDAYYIFIPIGITEHILFCIFIFFYS